MAALLLATPTPAEACAPQPDPGFFAQLSDGERAGVPTDGVIAFRAEAYGELEEALALLSIEVTQDGLPVAGAIETIELSTDDSFGTVTRLFVVWRPEAAFAPSTDYVASVAVADAWDREAPPVVTTLDITTGAGAAGPLPTLELGAVELTAEPFDADPRVCCDVGNSCNFADCQSPVLADRPVLRASLAIPDDPMAAQAYVRLSSGVDDALAEDAIPGLAVDVANTTFQRTFDAAAGNYCFGAELVSLIDGSAQPIVSQCEAHGDLELTTADNTGFGAFLEQCIGEPYWEDTEEPYVPDGGTDDGGDADGGSDGDGGDADGGSDADGGDADGGDADGGSDGDGGGLDDDARGCACTVQEGSAGWPALAMLVLVGGWLRRRR